MQTITFKGDNLYAKVRYNVNHNDSEYRWRMFIKDGDKDEVLILCKHINVYVDGQTYSEEIDGVGHYSLLYKSPRIVIDDNYVGWILKK